MLYMKRIFTSLICFVSVFAYAQCPQGFSELIITIVPDFWPHEVSWQVVNSETGQLIGTGTNSASDTFCVETNSCVLVRILDSFGDGIIEPGGYWIYLDGAEVANSSGSFSFLAEHSVACSPGTFCSSPIPLTIGTHTASFEDTWYSYTPVVAGMYNASTCSTNTCDTKIWIYEGCPAAITLSEGPEGTYAFNDNFCGVQAQTNIMMLPGHTYYLRIGDNVNSCSGDINFNFQYNGPIVGCTDIESCNFNPLATADDGSCIYYPNPLCTGPDLEFDSVAFVSSLTLQTHMAGNCDIQEGCVTGTGQRTVISFSSKINNIGPQDYYLGNSGTNPGMFSTQNCHGHTHYEGYGDYRLYDMQGNTIPVGHKNGFCVMDLCGFGQYNCGDMGISAGCYDVYGVGTQCQWIDVTDVPDGDYQLAVIINSLHLPDALGRNEMNYLNNALQVCIRIERNGAGVVSFELLPECDLFTDCNGVIGGTAISDCAGDCGGTAMFGNALVDGVVNTEDIGAYMELLATDSPVSTPCIDLDGSSSISVYDIALENWCLKNQEVNPNAQCNWPVNILNPTDTVGLAIANVNFTANYVDIEIRNPRCEVMAYQFGVSGVNITDVVSLSYPPDMPVQTGFNTMRSEVFALYTGDSVLTRFISPQDLIRVYFDQLTDSVVCIKNIVDVVNDFGQRTVHEIYGQCVNVPVNPDGFAEVSERTHLTIMPNPANETAFVNIPEGFDRSPSWTLFDAMGRLVKEIRPSGSSNAKMIQVNINELQQGVYFMRLTTADGKTAIGRLVKS